MTRKDRQRKKNQAQAHQRLQRARRRNALELSEAAAKKAKKGQKGVIAQMEKRGYTPEMSLDGKRILNWRRLHNPNREEVNA